MTEKMYESLQYLEKKTPFLFVQKIQCLQCIMFNLLITSIRMGRKGMELHLMGSKGNKLNLRGKRGNELTDGLLSLIPVLRIMCILTMRVNKRISRIIVKLTLMRNKERKRKKQRKLSLPCAEKGRSLVNMMKKVNMMMKMNPSATYLKLISQLDKKKTRCICKSSYFICTNLKEGCSICNKYLVICRIISTTNVNKRSFGEVF